ncbi:MAG: cytochrome b N-terminal domain-containing protein [Candidatus Aenigmatarchaeota archaeon]
MPDERNYEERERKGVLWEIFNLLTLTGFLYGFLDERLRFREAVEKQLNKPVPTYRTWIENNFLACLGGLSFVLFMIQMVTGVLLLMYYRPTVNGAFESVVEITNVVPFGWLIRGVHHWAANLMILTVIMHMFKVFFTGAYKPPRDLHWVSGVILFILTLLLGFSGYLLPWTQLSYWATTVGTESLGAVPFIGEQLKFFVRGGPQVGQLALTRFFALHVVILPGLTIFFLFSHFLMIRRVGISEPL